MTIKSSNLWILAEERPRIEVISEMLKKIARDNGWSCFVNPLRILPILEDGRFLFTYEVIGFKCNKVKKIFIKTISGSSSFVDYLIFYQNNQPIQKDVPLYAIEETKTGDEQSRNTSAFQRTTKFIFVEQYYPRIKKIMLYNLKKKSKKSRELTSTYILGMRMMIMLGVEIIGGEAIKEHLKPFKSIDELISFKKEMKGAPKGNVPITIKKDKNSIFVSGRLYKSGSLAHDPNIGALSLISAVLRKLGWKKEIIITNHGLEQKHLSSGNKFIKISNKLKIGIKGLKLPLADFKDDYWRYEEKGEKLGTIFVHLVVENFTGGHCIFENHAGCEKGYFLTKKGEHIALEKYSDRKAYKRGNKKKIISIPDLILIDFGRSEIINAEGKKYQFRKNGIKELKTFKDIEKRYITKYYPEFKIIRTVILYGSKQKKVVEMKVGFLLNENGELILGVRAPELFKKAIKNLIDFWS